MTGFSKATIIKGLLETVLACILTIFGVSALRGTLPTFIKGDLANVSEIDALLLILGILFLLHPISLLARFIKCIMR